MRMKTESLEISALSPVPLEAIERDSSGAAPVEQLAAGAVLRERYVIDSCLGRGGMGTVYKALDRFRHEHGQIDCYVAIKVLHDGTREQPLALARLRREFYCAQVLSHPNVVNVFELDRDGDLDFFTMEWLEGELLSAVLQQFAGRPMPRTAAWDIIRQSGEGIAHAHERKVVHADLKPQNIMLTKSGQVRILDFGASSGAPHALGQERSARNPLALTPAYASCELLAGKPADPRDDLYALACLSCELLAGRHPFWHQRSTEARMAQAVPTRPPNLTNRQWRALLQGMAWDRDQRSISVRDWLALLNPQSVGVHAIPRPQQLDMVQSAPAKLSAARVMAALGVFLACLSTWALFNRPARMGMVASATVAGPGVSQPTVSPTAPKAAVAEEQRAIPQVDHVSGSAPSELPSQPAAPKPMGAAINLASASYRLRPGANFAEVKVRRSSASSERASFEWWTEESSALSGVDYVAQPRSTVTFLPGSRTTSLFVKLLADSPRKRPAQFDVVIGGASRGTSLGVSRAQVMLAPGAAAQDTAKTPPDAAKPPDTTKTPDAAKNGAMTSMVTH